MGRFSVEDEIFSYARVILSIERSLMIGSVRCNRIWYILNFVYEMLLSCLNWVNLGRVCCAVILRVVFLLETFTSKCRNAGKTQI